MAFGLPGIAIRLAEHWQPQNRLADNKQIFDKVQTIKAKTEELFDLLGHSADKDEAWVFPHPLTLAGVSPGMVTALNDVLNADVYAEGAKPKRGRRENPAAFRLAVAFAEHFPMIAGIEASTTPGNRFVWALGEIFEALNFDAKPQHYAKRALAHIQANRVK